MNTRTDEQRCLETPENQTTAGVRECQNTKLQGGKPVAFPQLPGPDGHGLDRKDSEPGKTGTKRIHHHKKRRHQLKE